MSAILPQSPQVAPRSPPSTTVVPCRSVLHFLTRRASRRASRPCGESRRTENVEKEVYLASTRNRMPSSISDLKFYVGALHARLHGTCYLCHLPARRRTTPKRSKAPTRRVPMAVAMRVTHPSWGSVRPFFLDAPLWTPRRARPPGSHAPPRWSCASFQRPQLEMGRRPFLRPPGRGVCDTKVLLCDKSVRDDRQPPGVDEQAEGAGAG